MHVIVIRHGTQLDYWKSQIISFEEKHAFYWGANRTVIVTVWSSMD